MNSRHADLLDSHKTASKRLILTTPLSELRGIGPKRAEALAAAGFFQVSDLLRLQPRRYEDRTHLKSLSELTVGQGMQGPFRAVLKSVKCVRPRTGLSIVSAEFEEKSKIVKARWFNQPYLLKALVSGLSYFLYGKAVEIKGEPVLDNPEWEREENAEQPFSPGALTPVYSVSRALSEARFSNRSLRRLITYILSNIDWTASFPTIDSKSPFFRLRQSSIALHWPKTQAEADAARYTAAFFDQVLFQIGVWERRRRITGVFETQLEDFNNYNYINRQIYNLPFILTDAQVSALNKLLSALKRDASHYVPLNMLLQGDVGSGKTVVAFLGMRHYAEIFEPGRTCVFMAPTEILARQHKESFTRFFPDAADSADILIGALTSSERKLVLDKLASGKIRYLFGTHALFQDSVAVPFLGFCIIDEQQRFGVEHRRALTAKSSGRSPHLLLMSATPIPRTLALTIYGDLDICIIKDKPPGRAPVQTRLLADKTEALSEMRKTISRNEQVYYVCPSIETSEKISAASVSQTFELLQSALPEAKIAALTGNSPSEIRQSIMKDFHAGHIDVLIATTIIEVGIDAKKATLMVVENAERFGLSQLHQLRGRVGRSEMPSSCLLISSRHEENERLRLLTEIDDGFELAAEDLRLRGPGDLAGTRQSGLLHPAFSHRIGHELIEKARRRALEILTQEPSLVREWFLERMKASFGARFETFLAGG